MTNTSRLIRAITICVGALLFGTALGQYSGLPTPVTSPTPVYQQHQSYSDYYSEQLQSYNRPPVNVRQYTIDKYFYHRPTLSPYLNLTRNTGRNSLNNYYRYVIPEVDRRNQAAHVPLLTGPSMNAPPMPTTPPANPGHLPVANPYFNQYYNFGGGTLGSMTPPPTPLPKLYP